VSVDELEYNIFGNRIQYMIKIDMEVVQQLL